MFANCFIFFNYEKSMKINYISQNEKWRKKKINYCSVFSEKILYGGFKFSKINFSFAFRKKKNWSPKEKKRSDVHQQ